MRRILRPLIVIAAIVILIETWIWEHIGPLIGRLVEALPFKQLKQAIHDGIERLPPYATLVVFAVPAALLFPFKLAALALIASGHLVLGCAVLMLAKVVGVGIAAFLFETCKPKLMQIPLFVWAYDHWLRWLAWAHGHIDPVKQRIKSYARILRGGRSSRALRLLLRFRRLRKEKLRQGQAVPSSV
jgi:hypothetical protein